MSLLAIYTENKPRADYASKVARKTKNAFEKHQNLLHCLLNTEYICCGLTR